MPGKAASARRGQGRSPAKVLEATLDTLPAMSLAELRGLWEAEHGGQSPSLPEPLLRRLLAHRLQEARHGGLSRAAGRELERTARGEHQQVEAARPAPTAGPGTRLIREWNGQTITVHVRENDYLWEDRVYSSLSKIACEVTGARWSGPRFFGLTRGG